MYQHWPVIFLRAADMCDVLYFSFGRPQRRWENHTRWTCSAGRTRFVSAVWISAASVLMSAPPSADMAAVGKWNASIIVHSARMTAWQNSIKQHFKLAFSHF